MSKNFYDQAYYNGHYAHLLPDESYYQLKARFWKHAMCSLWPVPDASCILDYGCGLGQVTAAFENCHYFDIADFSKAAIRNRGRTFYTEMDQIPLEHFDVVVSSHSLEHTPDPCAQLKLLRRVTKRAGILILILPIEHDLRPHLELDNNNHLFAWTFQTISNLLRTSGWTPRLQDYIFDSCCLKKFSSVLDPQAAVIWSGRLGRMLGSYKSMFVVADNQE